jgi:phosphomethylpyrimidine synthase
MKITQDVRDYAAKLESDELEAEMQKKSAEFKELGSEIYLSSQASGV